MLVVLSLSACALLESYANMGGIFAKPAAGSAVVLTDHPLEVIARGAALSLKIGVFIFVLFCIV